MNPQELNERVAVEVMGWEFVTGKKVDKIRTWNEFEVYEDHWALNGKYVFGKTLPQWDSDWNAMRLVVEKMRDRGFILSVQENKHGQYRVFFDKSDDVSFTGGCHESLPTAACLAALEAVKGD